MDYLIYCASSSKDNICFCSKCLHIITSRNSSNPFLCFEVKTDLWSLDIATFALKKVFWILLYERRIHSKPDIADYSNFLLHNQNAEDFNTILSWIFCTDYNPLEIVFLKFIYTCACFTFLATRFESYE